MLIWSCWFNCDVAASYAERGQDLGNYIRVLKYEGIAYDKYGKLKPASEYLMHEYGHYLQSRRYGFKGYTRGGINSLFNRDEHDENAWYERNASNMGHDYFQRKGVDLTGWQDYWPGSADLQTYQWLMSIADFPFGRFNWWMNP